MKEDIHENKLLSQEALDIAHTWHELGKFYHRKLAKLDDARRSSKKPIDSLSRMVIIDAANTLVFIANIDWEANGDYTG
ncbi:MAG: hypothetical protein R2880_03845 [Deinococcales bacterium]